MRTSKSALIALAMLFYAGICFSQQSAEDARKAFFKANMLFGEEKYDEAIKAYEGIIGQGYESGNLYYNLANAYFKKGMLGNAILNYERARRLIPSDSDLKANYEYAGSLVKRAIAQQPPPHKRPVLFLSEQYTIDELAIFMSFLYVAFLLIFLGALFFKPVKRYALPLVPAFILLSALCFLALRHKTGLIGREAVIVTERTDVKFEPYEKATTHFTLYEGMKIYAYPSRFDWHKIERADGKAGWLERHSFEPI